MISFLWLLTWQLALHWGSPQVFKHSLTPPRMSEHVPQWRETKVTWRHHEWRRWNRGQGSSQLSKVRCRTLNIYSTATLTHHHLHIYPECHITFGRAVINWHFCKCNYSRHLCACVTHGLGPFERKLAAICAAEPTKELKISCWVQKFKVNLLRLRFRFHSYTFLPQR